MINIDKLKEKLIKTKIYISNNNLTEEEEKEIDLYIEGLVSDLQEKLKNINIENVAKNIEKLIKEESNG